MKCYAPLRAYKTSTGIYFDELKRNGDYLGQLDLPCGQCVGCRERRASDWELRIMHEARQWKQNCFVTLTYAPGNLPPNGSLSTDDITRFHKRVNYHNGGLRYYTAGEYGPETQRPHYHGCLFGIDYTDRKIAGTSESGEPFYDSPTLTKHWGLGRASVQDLTHGTAAYAARYIMSKKLGKDAKYLAIDANGNMVEIEPERSWMSLKPGIGEGFFNQYKRDIYPHDFVISRGVKRRPPRYYDKLLERQAPDTADNLKATRELNAAKYRDDNTPARLTVQEAVHVERIKNRKRNAS